MHQLLQIPLAPSTELASEVQNILKNQISTEKLNESLTKRFCTSMQETIEETLRTHCYTGAPEAPKGFLGELTKAISQLVRNSFPMIFHSVENTYYMYSESERTFLEVNRDSLVEASFAYVEQAQYKIEAEGKYQWIFAAAEQKLRKQIKEGFRPRFGTTDGAQERNLLVFRNAVIDLTKDYSQDLFKTTPMLGCSAPDGSVFNTQTINANLVPAPQRPDIWHRALQVMGFESPGMMNAIEDILLYLVTPSKAREELFYWYGKGANGKSVLIKFLIDIVGRRHVASVSLDDLQSGSGGFAWEGLLGKRLNLPAESGSSGFMDSEKLKAIITDDSIAINRKNRPYIDVVLPIKFVFAANRLPLFSEKTHAMYRRFRLLRFDKVVDEADKIQDFHEVLLSHRDEIVSWWLFNHLKRYQKFNPKFELPELFESWRLEAMRGEGDAVAVFVEARIEFTGRPDDIVRSAELARAFKDFCKEEELSGQKLGDNAIYRKFSDDFELVKKTNPLAALAAEGSTVINRNQKRERYYRGLRLLHS